MDGVENFHLSMNLKRFKFIIRCIRFDDKFTLAVCVQCDRLVLVRKIFSQFVTNCQRCYSLGENVTVDEKLESFHWKFA